MEAKGTVFVHKIPPLNPILSRLNPTYKRTTFLQIYFNAALSHTPRYHKWALSCLSINIHELLISPCTRHVHPSCSSAFMTRLTFGEEYKIWNSSLCIFLHAFYFITLRFKSSPRCFVLNISVYSKWFWRWCITLRITGCMAFAHRAVF
jgi:hypothetical protein